MKQDTQYEVGEQVEFTGFTGNELPDNHDLVEEGQVYAIIEVAPQDDQNEEFYTVAVANPKYNPDKRKTKNNQPEIGVELYADEFILPEEVDEEEVEEVEEEVAEEPEIVEAVEEEVEEEKPAPKAKPKTKAKPATKAKTKAKPKAKTKAAPKAKAKVVAEEPKTELVEVKSKLKEASDPITQDPENDGVILLSREEEDAEILEMISGDADLCALAEEMNKEVANLDYMLGGLLYHIHTSKAYKELDPRYAQNKGFALYVDEKLNIRYRTAMNHISVYTMFSRLGIDREEYGRLGSTKWTEIARVATENNIDDLIGLAEDATVIEIKDSIKESYVAGESGEVKKVKRVAFKFMLHEDQGATVRKLFEEAKQALGVESDEDAFESIVTEWAMDHLNVKGAAKTKAKARASAKSKAKAKDEVEATA